MKIDNTPVYKKIKEAILNNISTGIYAPGDKIPNQSYYAQKYGVSRVTVREAMNELKHRGIIYSVKGKGTFVLDVTKNFYDEDRLIGTSRQKDRKNIQLHSEVLYIGKHLAEKRIATQLEIEENTEIFMIKRLRYADKVCIAVETSFLIWEYVASANITKAELETGSLYEILRKRAGIVFTCANEEIHALLCDEQTAKYFNIEPMDPVLFVKRKTLIASGKVMEFCENYERGDEYGIRIRTMLL